MADMSERSSRLEGRMGEAEGHIDAIKKGGRSGGGGKPIVLGGPGGGGKKGKDGEFVLTDGLIIESIQK